MESGVQTKVMDLRHQAESRDKPRMVVCKIDRHVDELFLPRILKHNVITIYNITLTTAASIFKISAR